MKIVSGRVSQFFEEEKLKAKGIVASSLEREIGIKRTTILTWSIFAGTFLFLALLIGLRSSESWQIATNISSVLNCFIVAISIEAIVLTYRGQADEKHHYALDDFYFRLLGMAMEKPYFRDPVFISKWAAKETAEPEQAQQYELYAFMMWNFIESIYDRSERYKAVKATWCPIMKQEALLHWAWFSLHKNRVNFKASFITGIEKYLNNETLESRKQNHSAPQQTQEAAIAGLDSLFSKEKRSSDEERQKVQFPSA